MPHEVTITEAKKDNLRNNYLTIWIVSTLAVPTIIDFIFFGSAIARYARILIFIGFVATLLVKNKTFLVGKATGVGTLAAIFGLYAIGTISAVLHHGVITPNFGLLFLFLIVISLNSGDVEKVFELIMSSVTILIVCSVIAILLRMNPRGYYASSDGYPVYLQFVGIPGRNYGIFSHPNQLGQAAAISFLFFLFSDKNRIWLLLPLFCLIKCGSRTSIIACLVGLVVFLSVYITKNKKRNPRNKMQLGMVVGTLVGLLLMALVSQFVILIPHLNGDSLTGRVQIWQTSLELFRNSSLLGLGWGWEQRAIDAQLLNIWAVSSHNEILEVMFSSGILGLLAFLFLPIKVVVNFNNLLPFEKAFMLATLISSASEAYLDLQYPTIQTYLMLVVILCSDSKRNHE